MTQKHFYACLAALLAVLTACSGSMQGVVRQDAKRVSMNYSDSRIGTADVQVVMPGGERFEGRTNRGTDSTTPNPGAAGNSENFEAVENFDGNADAVLRGNRGNIMKCRFHLTDIIIGFTSGGYGLCQVSDGRVMDIFF